MSNYRTVQEVIDVLNNNEVDYLVLRNYENLLDENIYVGGHEDIDFLVADSREVIQTLKAISNRKTPDYTHYHIYVSGNRVNLDLRSIGDGYYCKKWQEEMLSNKINYKGFYVMSPVDYFYSLIYHAIIQKKSFTDEYRMRLTEMAKRLNINLPTNSQEAFIICLENYMFNNGYKFVFTDDPSIPLRFELVRKQFIERNIPRQISRINFRLSRLFQNVVYYLYRKLFNKQ